MINFRPGDGIGISGRNCRGRVIQACTCAMGGINHVVLVGQGSDGVRWWEASTTTRTRDLYADKVLSGVQVHHIARRLAEEGPKGSVVWHYPIRVPLLHPGMISGLREWCRNQHGRPYDYYGAFQARVLAGGSLRRWLFRTRENLHSYFCSEFVAAALRQVGEFPCHDASEWSPAALCHALVETGSHWPPVLIQGPYAHWGRRVG